ncbi:putative quinate permease [Cercospora beticola]|uniref:Putative quinate permease n=1 Tax=Cercospora beticola TaxID=122368 RepID=A0A2G5HUW6_CERBT|nr:putative quinate permease [Cercospora beticola]PIA96083.1 putative quinate permease [Cercospora beticola]WPB06843.1 hypothetical protein RHO25_011503 [Cercospora beticola]
MAEKDPATMADKDLDAVKDERIEYLDDEPIPYDDVSYGPGGMRGLWQSPYVVAAAFLASLGGFSFGYDQGVISIINTMEQFHEQFPRAATPFGKGFMTGMLEFGAFIGALAFPYLADRISRKRALSVVTVIFNIGAIMQTAAQDYGTLVAGRTIGGIGVGTLALGAPLYISEIAPPNIRGSLLVLESISIVSGVVISFWITYGTKDLAGDISFRLPLGLQMVSATLLAIFINFFPFSPRWLAMRDRSDDCLKSLSQLRRLPAEDSRVQAEFTGIMTEVRFQNIVQERRHPGVTGIKREMWSWLDLFRKKIWRRLVVGVGVAFFQQFSGINAFIYYAPTLFESLGQTPEMALILSGVFNYLQLVAVAVCFVVIDHVGRRPLAIWGGFGCCICYIIIAALSSVYEDDWSQNSAAGWACVAMAFMFILIYGVSYSPLGWALPPEVFPNSMRSKGVALSVATIWLCNFIIGVATPPMLASLGYGTYIFFAAWCGLAGVWAFLFVPETQGKTLEQMDEAFGDTSGQEEMAIMAEAQRTVSIAPEKVVTP